MDTIKRELLENIIKKLRKEVRTANGLKKDYGDQAPYYSGKHDAFLYAVTLIRDELKKFDNECAKQHATLNELVESISKFTFDVPNDCSKL